MKVSKQSEHRKGFLIIKEMMKRKNGTTIPWGRTKSSDELPETIQEINFYTTKRMNNLIKTIFDTVIMERRDRARHIIHTRLTSTER